MEKFIWISMGLLGIFLILVIEVVRLQNSIGRLQVSVSQIDQNLVWKG